MSEIVRNRTVLRRARLVLSIVVASLAATTASNAFGDQKEAFTFVNVIDNSGADFSGFGGAPSINNDGSVAFLATGSSFVQGVFRAQYGRTQAIVLRKAGVIANFGDDVIINNVGVVGYDASLNNTGERAIFTSDGITATVVVDSVKAGLAGAPFLSIGGLNDAGTAVFQAFRADRRSQAIFTGSGGALSIIADTNNSNFQAFGNAAISNGGEVVFRGFRNDSSEGLFAGRGGATLIADTSGAFSDFLDPVINNSGVVADAGFLTAGGIEVFTGTGGPVRPRTDPASMRFSNVDNVTVNNSGDIAFFADEATGGQGIFLLRKDSDVPAPMIHTGDKLFGSVVAGLSLGRFSLNEHDQVVFTYALQGGRAGIAVVSRGDD